MSVVIERISKEAIPKSLLLLADQVKAKLMHMYRVGLRI